MAERTAPTTTVTISDRPRGAEIKAYRKAAGVSRRALAATAIVEGLAGWCDPDTFIGNVEDWYADRALDRRVAKRYVAAIDSLRTA